MRAMGRTMTSRAIEQAQPELLQAEIASLAPQRKGTTNVYAIGIAGVDQDVFGKELDGALAAIAAILPIKERTIRLINSHTTAPSVPLATLHNFAAAVHGIAKAMDKDEDVLILVMTSHGERPDSRCNFPAIRSPS